MVSKADRRCASPLVVAAAISALVALIVAGRRHASGPANAQSTDPEEIQVLDREVLRTRSIEVFSSAYVTALSIVLGIALGTAAMAVGLVAPTLAGYLLIGIALRAFVVLVAVIVVFYNYVWFLVIFRWALGALDSVIPLVLGSSVIALAVAVPTPGAWVWCMTAMYVIGAASFGRTIARSSKKHFASLVDHRRAIHLLWFLTAMAAGGAVLCSLALWLQVEFSDTILGVLTIIFAGVMVGRSEWILGKIYQRNRLASR